MNNYEDIIDLPHHVSKTRPQMPIYNRSIQFAPFAALSGYDDSIKETARLTDKKIDIDEGLKAMLNNKLRIINEHINENHDIEFLYFFKDEKKDGGIYKTYVGIVKKIDKINKIIYMKDGKKIIFDDILNITSKTLNLELE